MSANQDLDLMLENFLSENTLADDGFSEKVLLALPAPTKWSWLSDVTPALVMAFVFVVGWKMNLLNPQIWMSLLDQAIDFQSLHMTTLSFNVSVGMMAGAFLLVAYMLYEKFVESF